MAHGTRATGLKNPLRIPRVVEGSVKCYAATVVLALPAGSGLRKALTIETNRL